MAGQLDEAAKQVLATLLADFVDRGLSAEELKGGYEGPQIEVLATAVCNVEDITKVDFEIAFGDLEKNKLVRTGPRVAFDNDSNSSLIFIGSYSKREYAYLSEEGYKAARKAPNRPQQRVQRVVNNVHISGGQFGNLQLAAGENVQQSMNSHNGADSDVILQLISILEAQGQQVSSEQRAGIEAAVSEASQGNAGTAKSVLEKVFGPMWGALQPVMWPIIGEVVKKSIGI